MSENHLVIKARRKANSLSQYIIRYDKDRCLHDDVESFMFKRGDNLARLVDKLIKNDFVLARYTDPSYPD